MTDSTARPQAVDRRPGAPYPPIRPSTAQRIRDRLARANARKEAELRAQRRRAS